MSCKIITSENGDILEVRNNQEGISVLYDDLLKKYKDSKLSLDLWTIIHTSQFKNIYGESNNEPSLLEFEKIIEKIIPTSISNINNEPLGSIVNNEVIDNDIPIQMYVKHEDGTEEASGMYLPSIESRVNTLKEKRAAFISNFNRSFNSDVKVSFNDEVRIRNKYEDILRMYDSKINTINNEKQERQLIIDRLNAGEIITGKINYENNGYTVKTERNETDDSLKKIPVYESIGGKDQVKKKNIQLGFRNKNGDVKVNNIIVDKNNKPILFSFDKDGNRVESETGSPKSEFKNVLHLDKSSTHREVGLVVDDNLGNKRFVPFFENYVNNRNQVINQDFLKNYKALVLDLFGVLSDQSPTTRIVDLDSNPLFSKTNDYKTLFNFLSQFHSGVTINNWDKDNRKVLAEAMKANNMVYLNHSSSLSDLKTLYFINHRSKTIFYLKPGHESSVTIDLRKRHEALLQDDEMMGYKIQEINEKGNLQELLFTDDGIFNQMRFSFNLEKTNTIFLPNVNEDGSISLIEKDYLDYINDTNVMSMTTKSLNIGTEENPDYQMFFNPLVRLDYKQERKNVITKLNVTQANLIETDDKKMYYEVVDGKVIYYDRVTSIISDNDSELKDSFEIILGRAIHNSLANEASNFNENISKLKDIYLNNYSEEVAKEKLGKIVEEIETIKTLILNELDINNFTIVGQEVQVKFYNDEIEKGIAGKIDLIVQDRYKNLHIIDIKTSNHSFEDKSLDTINYYEAQAGYYKALYNKESLRKIEKVYVLHVETNMNDSQEIESSEASLHEIIPLETNLTKSTDNQEESEDDLDFLNFDINASIDRTDILGSIDHTTSRLTYKNKLDSITIYSLSEVNSEKKQVIPKEASKEEIHRIFQHLAMGIGEIVDTEGLDIYSAINKYFSDVIGRDLASKDKRKNMKATIYFQIKDVYASTVGNISNNNAKELLLQYLSNYGHKVTLSKFIENIFNKKAYSDIILDDVLNVESRLDEESNNRNKAEEKDFKERQIDPTSYIKEELIQLILTCQKGRVELVDAKSNIYREVPNIDSNLELPLYVTDWKGIMEDIKQSVEQRLEDSGTFTKEDLLVVLENKYKVSRNLIYYQLYQELSKSKHSQSLNQMYQYLNMHYVKHAADNIVSNDPSAKRKKDKGSHSALDETRFDGIGNVANALSNARFYSRESKGVKKIESKYKEVEKIHRKILDLKAKKNPYSIINKDEKFNDDLNTFQKNAKAFYESIITKTDINNIPQHSLMMVYLYSLGFGNSDIVNMMNYFHNETGFKNNNNIKTSSFSEILSLNIHANKNFFDWNYKTDYDFLKKINKSKNKSALELFLPPITTVVGNKVTSFFHAQKMIYPLVRNNHVHKVLRALRARHKTKRVNDNIFLTALQPIVQENKVNLSYLKEPIINGEVKDLKSLNDFEMDLVLLNNFFYGFDQYNTTNGHGFITPTNSVVSQKGLVTFRTLLAGIELQPDIEVSFDKKSISKVKISYKRITKNNNPYLMFIKNEYQRMKLANERFQKAQEHYKKTKSTVEFEKLRLNDDYYISKKGEYMPGLGTYFIQFGSMNSLLGEGIHPLSEKQINLKYKSEEEYLNAIAKAVLKEHTARLNKEILMAYEIGILKHDARNLLVFNELINYNKRTGIQPFDHIDYFAQYHLNQELSNLLYNQITFHHGFVAKVEEKNGSIDLVSSINETMEAYGKRKKSNFSPLDNVDSTSIEIRAIVLNDIKYDYSEINSNEFKRMFFANILSKYYDNLDSENNKRVISSNEYNLTLELLVNTQLKDIKNINSYIDVFKSLGKELNPVEEQNIKSYLESIYKISKDGSIKSYTSIDKTDGAVYTHINEGIDNLVSKGMINHDEGLFLKELHSSPRNLEEYKIIMSSITKNVTIIINNNNNLKQHLKKLNYRGKHDNYKINNLIKLGISGNKSGVFGEDVYMKCAEFYLSPLFHTAGFGKQALKLMNTHNANRVVFKSSMKKIVPEINIYKEGKKDFQVLVMNAEDFGNQLQTQGETKSKINNPSQMDMIMFANYDNWKNYSFTIIDDRGEYKDINGKELADTYNKGLKDLYNNLVDQYAEKFGLIVNTDSETGIKNCKFKDRYSFIQYCHNIIENGDVNEMISNQLKDFLYLNNQHTLEQLFVKQNTDINKINKKYEEGLITKEERDATIKIVKIETESQRNQEVKNSRFSGIPFFHDNWNSLMRMMISHYHKNMIKPKVNGSIMTLNPECIIKSENILKSEENENLFKNNSIIFTDPNRTSNELGPNEVILSFSMLASNFKGDLDIMDFITYKKDGSMVIDSSKLDPRLLRAIGYRVPLQGPNSVRSIKIAGFFMPGINNTVMASSALIDQTGWDFDIDKLYMLFPYSELSFGERDERGLTKKEMMKEELEDYIFNMRNDQFNSLPKNIKNSISSYQNTVYDSEKKETARKDRLMTELIVYFNLFNDKKTLDYLVKLTGQESSVELENQRLFELKYAYFSQQQVLEDVYKPNSYGQLIQLAKEYKKKHTSGVITSFSNERRREEDAAAKEGQHGIAKFSLWQTGIAKLQLANARLKKDAIIEYVDIKGDTRTLESFNRIYSINNTSKILSIIQILSSISVDNEKEPIMSTINLIGETFNLAGVLATLGLDDTEIFRVLTFPLFNEFIKDYKYTGNKNKSFNNISKRYGIDENSYKFTNLSLFKGNSEIDNFKTLESIITIMSIGDETLGFIKSLNNNAEENPSSEFELVNDGNNLNNLLTKDFKYISIGVETRDEKGALISREKEGLLELNENLNIFGLIDNFFNKNAYSLFSTTNQGESLDLLFSDNIYNSLSEIMKKYVKFGSNFTEAENMKPFFSGFNTYLYNVVDIETRNNIYDKLMITPDDQLLLYERLIYAKKDIEKQSDENDVNVIDPVHEVKSDFLKLFYIPIDKDEVYFTNYSNLSYNEIQSIVYKALLIENEEFNSLVRDILTYYIIKGDHVSKKVDFLKFIPIDIIKEFIGDKLDFIYKLNEGSIEEQIAAQKKFDEFLESYYINYVLKNKKYLPEAFMKLDESTGEYAKVKDKIDPSSLTGHKRKVDKKDVLYPIITVFENIYAYNQESRVYQKINPNNMYGDSMVLLNDKNITDNSNEVISRNVELITYIISKLDRLSGEVVPINSFFRKILGVISTAKYYNLNPIKLGRKDGSYDSENKVLTINEYYEKKMNSDLHGFISTHIEAFLEAALDIIELNKTSSLEFSDAYRYFKDSNNLNGAQFKSAVIEMERDLLGKHEMTVSAEKVFAERIEEAKNDEENMDDVNRDIIRDYSIFLDRISTTASFNDTDNKYKKVNDVIIDSFKIFDGEYLKDFYSILDDLQYGIDAADYSPITKSFIKKHGFKTKTDFANYLYKEIIAFENKIIDNGLMKAEKIKEIYKTIADYILDTKNEKTGIIKINDKTSEDYDLALNSLQDLISIKKKAVKFDEFYNSMNLNDFQLSLSNRIKLIYQGKQENRVIDLIQSVIRNEDVNELDANEDKFIYQLLEMIYDESGTNQIYNFINENQQEVKSKLKKLSKDQHLQSYNDIYVRFNEYLNQQNVGKGYAFNYQEENNVYKAMNKYKEENPGSDPILVTLSQNGSVLMKNSDDALIININESNNDIHEEKFIEDVLNDLSQLIENHKGEAVFFEVDKKSEYTLLKFSDTELLPVNFLSIFLHENITKFDNLFFVNNRVKQDYLNNSKFTEEIVSKVELAMEEVNSNREIEAIAKRDIVMGKVKVKKSENEIKNCK